MTQRAVKLLVDCLENEGVEYVFGIPGEENIRLVDALDSSSIRFILTRSEQGASFMADMYGRVSGKAGVCTATLGPGAINLLLGVADANCDSTPLVAITAQVGLNRIYKETHQFVDLETMFKPVTKWTKTTLTPNALPEMVRAAFKSAESERPGAAWLGVPEDVEAMDADASLNPLPKNRVRAEAPSPDQVARAAEALKSAERPIVLAGHGAARAGAGAALVQFAEKLGIPVATTFHGKGVMPDDHPNALGTTGFMVHDYTNFGFDRADLILSVGFELQEIAPRKLNPDGDKKIIHIHRFPAEVDANYSLTVGIEGDISRSLEVLGEAVDKNFAANWPHSTEIRAMVDHELSENADNPAFPVKPQRIVSDIRKAMGRKDVVLADTGAIKMWMARLYPTYAANTCLISNGLATMAFALPGAIGVKLAEPERKVLAVMGDGSFMMNSQELETAVRLGIPMVVLIWEDNSYGLIKWKMELEIKRHKHVDFNNPDFVAYANSFGAKGYRIDKAEDLLPTLKKALAEDGVSVITCPVDYSENTRLTDRLGELTAAL
ncbi:acetolactate synthase large subunit [Martelella mediterranea]|uniref:Acetolactate synthase-1/2/3 large subunit n=1 Tax=Martelella mediterranea TaxID=293089 RepID=A0A4R3NXZ9_9HYPH|nr:acetolactate synthase large subunit [Martelella mediterranea]TCT42886.1 acetolactate synthase-1/2/3 large subunit [Martelella mediterranea]